MSYLSGRFREIEGDFWVMCLRFSVDRTDVITGKYPTTLKSVCSLWTSLKFIASLRQIAANEIAAFWLGTDGKRIVLKKNNCYYPSSVRHLKSGLLQLFSLGYPQEEILSESSRTWWQEKVSWHNLVLDTNIFGQGAYLSFWVEEGRLFFFFFPTSPSASSHWAPAPETLSSHSSTGSSPRGTEWSLQGLLYPPPSASPWGPADHYPSKTMFMATLLCFSTLLGGRRKILAGGRGRQDAPGIIPPLLEHHPCTSKQKYSTAGQSGARQATGLARWMPPPHGILVSSGFLCAWSHSAPRASVPWSALTASWRCSEVRLVMTRRLAREEARGRGAVWLPPPSPSPGVPTAPRLGGVNGKLPADLSRLRVKHPE